MLLFFNAHSPVFSMCREKKARTKPTVLRRVLPLLRRTSAPVPRFDRHGYVEQTQEGSSGFVLLFSSFFFLKGSLFLFL
jgi:hypothetical protein